jgi:hypothetical protein
MLSIVLNIVTPHPTKSKQGPMIYNNAFVLDRIESHFLTGNLASW